MDLFYMTSVGVQFLDIMEYSYIHFLHDLIIVFNRREHDKSGIGFKCQKVNRWMGKVGKALSLIAASDRQR